MLQKLFLVAMLLGCNACSFNLGSGGTERNYYVINELPSTKALSQRLPARITVRRSDANRFIDSHKILFTNNPSVLNYYQFGTWVETPVEYFTFLLTRKFEAAGCFAAVMRSGQAGSDFVLETEILDFYHDTSKHPGEAKVKVAATLLDLRQGDMLGRQEFFTNVPVPSYDAAGAVAGLQQAVNTLSDQVVAWAAGIAEQHLPSNGNSISQAPKS